MLNWMPGLGCDGDARREHGAPQVALAVCGPGTPGRILVDGECGVRLVATGFRDLDAALARHAPALVLAHAVSRGFDALDVGLRLVERGYGGRLAVVACGSASAAVVRAEVERACPGLAIAMIDAAPCEPPLLRAV